MNLYRNGYLCHFIIGFATMVFFFDFGLWWGVGATALIAGAKEVIDIKRDDDVSVENTIDFLCTLAGGVVGIFAEIIKSICL